MAQTRLRLVSVATERDSERDEALAAARARLHACEAIAEKARGNAVKTKRAYDLTHPADPGPSLDLEQAARTNAAHRHALDVQKHAEDAVEEARAALDQAAAMPAPMIHVADFRDPAGAAVVFRGVAHELAVELDQRVGDELDVETDEDGTLVRVS